MRNKILLLLFLALTAAGLTGSAFPLTVSITGQTPVNQCEADTYYITVENPAWQTETAENIIITNTMPPDGFVFQDSSAVITTPSGSLSGTPADPSFVGQDCTWDLDTLFGDIYLTPGQSLDIKFNMEIDCSGNSGQDDLLVEYDFPSPNAQSDTDNLFITVLPGDINVIKSPVTQEASRGEWTTYTIKIESSGLGSIKNVVVRDTFGTGISYVDADPDPGSSVGSTYYWTAANIPGLAEMAPDEAEWITLTALVNACTGLDNVVNASFGCEGMTSVSDTVCLDTATEIPPGTAAATIDYQLKPPDISFSLSPSMVGIDYCTQTTITVAVTNGDPGSPDPEVGNAYNLFLDTSLDTTGYDITGVVDAVYSGGDFTVGTVPANDTVYFSYDCGWTSGSCPPNGDPQNTLWLPMYDDQCMNHFAPPVAIFPISMTGMPSLTISKTNPGIVNGNDDIEFTLTINYSGPPNFTPTVTDEYPKPSPGWTIQSITQSGVDDSDKITWTPTLDDGDTWNASFSMVLADPCVGPPVGSYTNTAFVTGGTDCQGCVILGDNDPETFYVEDTPGCDGTCNVDGTRTGPGTVEVCTFATYTNAYTLSGTGLPASWAASTMTDNMILSQSYSSLDAVIVDGTDYGAFVSYTDNGGGGGTFEVYLEGLDSAPGCPAPAAASTLVIVYTFQADDVTGENVYSQTDLIIGSCGVERNWLPITIARSAVGIGVSGPSITDRCGVETYTLSLSKNAYIAYDLLAVLDLDQDGNGTDNYYYMPGTTFFSGTFSEDGGGIISAFEPDTSIPGELRWDFSTQGGGSGDMIDVGDILVDLRMPCTASVYTYAAEAEYNDRCYDETIPRESSVSAGPDEPMWVREGDISMVKMPESYYATEDIAIWSLTVINGGDGAAYNLEVIDTLDTDLSYYYGVPEAEDVSGQVITWNFQSLTATWAGLTDLDGEGYFNDLVAGGTVTVTLGAHIDDCDDLDNEVYSEWGCCTGPCQTSNLALSQVIIPPPGLLGVTTFPMAINLCETATVYFSVRNSGQTNIYNICAAENLPTGADYVSGSSEYRYNSGSGWTGFTDTLDPDYWSAQTCPYHWTAQTHIPEFADLPVGARVQIQFEVEANCDFPAGDRTFLSRAGFETPCGEYNLTSETRAALSLNDMDVQIVKEGRNETRDPGGALSTDPVIADAWDTVYWRVTITNSGDTAAEMVTMTDTLPDTVTYFTADPPPNYQSGQIASWVVGTDLPFVVSIEATVNDDGCEALSINTVDASWGCQSLGCTSGSKQETASLITEVDFNLPGTNVLTSFDTCGGSISFFVENEGATAKEIDFLYSVPDGYYYDATGGGATISSTDPFHNFTPPRGGAGRDPRDAPAAALGRTDLRGQYPRRQRLYRDWGDPDRQFRCLSRPLRLFLRHRSI